MAEKVVKSKKGPGRPPAKKDLNPVEHLGIVPKPSDPAYRLEVVYDKPAEFKNIFTYLKNIKAKEIHLKCNPKYMALFVRDHINTQRTVVRIEGSNVNNYYCNGEFILHINMDFVEKIFSSIDASISTITFIQEEHTDSHLYIILHNIVLGRKGHYKVNLSSFNEDLDLYDSEKLLSRESLDSYPISYTMTAKDFKKSVSDILALTQSGSESVILEKNEGEPIHFSYENQKLGYNEVYEKADQIKLRDKLGSSSLRVDIKITNIKCLYSAMLANDINIFVKEEADMIFTTTAEDELPEEGGIAIKNDGKAIIVSTLLKLR
jgi:hypothetical protein